MARTKTSKAWMHEHVTDPYVRRAKQEGYRSRAAYKLIEVLEKDKLVRPGMTVVDLGAAPGGWSQVLAPLVGTKGRVIALDVVDMEPVEGVHIIRGDFSETTTLERLEMELAGRQIDLVISDMAPNISGVGLVDQARSIGLAELALEFAVNHLKPQGNFLVKLFQGSGFEALVADIRRKFVQVMIRKPDASRSRSSEVYVVAKGLKARG